MTSCSQPKRKVRVSQGRNKELILISYSAGKKTAATAKPTKKAQKEGSSKDGSDTGDLSNSVNSLKVSDVPPPKSKGLDVLKEFEKSNAKRSTSFVVVGECMYH